MILSSEVTYTDVQQMYEFYKQNFAVVEMVICNKCDSPLAFECQGGDTMGLPTNELGKVVIPIGDNLLSHRIRLDEAPTGERMVGYQCGVMLPNPLYQPAQEAYAAAKADYDKKYDAEHAKAVKAHDKLVKQAEKKGDALPGFNKPPYDPPMPPNIAEKIPCGNDTRIGDVERGKVPVGNMQISLSPFEKHQIREQIRGDKKYKADFKKVGNTKHFETFRVERIE